MMFLIDWIRGLTRIDVAATERVLVLHKGRISDVLGPGEHRVRARGLELERHDLARPQFVSKFERVLMAERPDLAERELTVVQADEGEVIVVFRDGALFDLSRSPRERTVLWTEAGPWELRRFDLANDLRVPEDLRTEVEAGALRTGGREGHGRSRAGRSADRWRNVHGGSEGRCAPFLEHRACRPGPQHRHPLAGP